MVIHGFIQAVAFSVGNTWDVPFIYINVKNISDLYPFSKLYLFVPAKFSSYL
jgi:hypothetical protein